MKILQYAKPFIRFVKSWFKEAYDQWDDKDNFEQGRIIVTVITGAATVLTVFNAAWVYLDNHRNANEILRRKDLSTYANYGGYAEDYRKNIQKAIANFLYQFEISYNKPIAQKINQNKKQQKITILFLSPNQIKERCKSINLQHCADTVKKQITDQKNSEIFYYFKIEKNPDPKLYDNTIGIYAEKISDKSRDKTTEIYTKNPERLRFDQTCKALLASTKSNTGFEVFASDNFEDFRKIHDFYESLGFAIKNHLIQFETVFNMFTYPATWTDKYYDNEISPWATFDPFFEIETCLRKNWFGESNSESDTKSLQDFSDNFLQLGNNYHYKRISNEYNNLSCKIWWQFWKNQPATKDEKKCDRLGKVINTLEEYHIQSNLIWRKLYNSPNLWFQIREWWFGTNWWIIRIGSISFLIIVGWSMHTKFISTRNKNTSPNPSVDSKDIYYIDYRNRK